MESRGFFPMPRRDALIILLFIILAVVFFMPWTRQITINGVVLFGWLMGLFMFFAPLVTLISLYTEPQKSAVDHSESKSV